MDAGILPPKGLDSLARRFGLDLIVLFGSRVRGRAGAKSDADIAVLRRRGREGPAPSELDLSYEVARDGRVLYERRPGTFFMMGLMKGAEKMCKAAVV